MGKSDEGGSYDEGNLYDHMPVYHARLSGVRQLINGSEMPDLEAFHMHYHGTVPLESASKFFDSDGTLLDLGCGYGSNVIWFARKLPGLRSLLGVDLIPEHIDIAEQLAVKLCAGDNRLHFLARDISELTPEIFEVESRVQTATSILALNTFLHLNPEQRLKSWQFVDKVLAPGGQVYVEDFFARRLLTAHEYETMVRESGCAYLPLFEQYTDEICKALPQAQIDIEDISNHYRDYAKSRHLGYTGQDADKIRFYKTVFQMLDTGAVGGIRLKIRR